MKRSQRIALLTLFVTAAIGLGLTAKLTTKPFASNGPSLRGLTSLLPAVVSADNTYTLNLAFEGTWAFVVDANGKVKACTPNVFGHTEPYIWGVDERPLLKGDYVLDITNYQDPNVTDYDSSATDKEYKRDLKAGEPVDPQGNRYVCISLPKPLAFVPLHKDEQEITETDPGDNYGAPGKFYPTIMALRFTVKDFKMVNITGPGFNQPYSPQIPTIGNEGLLFIKVGPEEPDDAMHSHARYAFNQLISLFPTKALWTASPPPKKKRLR